MPNYQAITRERHAQKRWFRQSSFAFAAADAVAPLTAVELPKAVMSLPIALIKQSEGYMPVAVLSLRPGMNLFVAPDWRWIGNYIPAVFRAYPFRLGQSPDGKDILCIDEAYDRVTDGPTGEPFFTDEGQPAQGLLDILYFLNHIEQNRLVTVAACAALQKYQLIQPWPVTCKTESGEKPVTGLFRIDEGALIKLSGEALHELVQAGALLLAHCQLLSMQHLPLLGQMAETHAKLSAQALAAQNTASNPSPDLSFFSKNGTINFSGLV